MLQPCTDFTAQQLEQSACKAPHYKALCGCWDGPAAGGGSYPGDLSAATQSDHVQERENSAMEMEKRSLWLPAFTRQNVWETKGKKKRVGENSHFLTARHPRGTENKQCPTAPKLSTSPPALPWIKCYLCVPTDGAFSTMSAHNNTRKAEGNERSEGKFLLLPQIPTRGTQKPTPSPWEQQLSQ